MPIASTDLIFKLSVATGPGNSTAAVTPADAGSLGGFISTTPITDATLDNLFPDVTGDENAADNVDYKCIFIHNSNATLTLQRAVAWLAAEVAGGANTAIAVDNIGATSVSSSTAQAASIPNKNTAPTGVGPFSSPSTKATGISLGDIPPGEVVAIWVQRTATNSAAQNNDGVTIRVEGDTAA
jgi:hypothetical protein